MVECIKGFNYRSRPNIKEYWARIKNAYNNDDVHQSGQFCERSWTQLKSRWNRIHPPIQKFNGCYKQADKHRRSESSEKDILADAHMIYSQDTGKKFEIEHAWLLLKDQPKFDAEFMSKCSKRTKVSTSGNYLLSSNVETPIEVEEYDTPSPMSRPIGQKATKRKSKGKECPNTLDLSGIESVMKDKNMNTSKLIQLKEAQEKRLQEHERRMEYEILMKDTSNSNHDEYFQMRVDALRRKGLSPLQKCTTTIHILAYGSPADSVDEYVRIGETTAVECLERFVLGICTIFGNEYLRRPNNDDIKRLLQMGAAHGFPGMLGSIGCMHWEWKNCPVAWKGQFCRDDHRNPTIILEAVASQDLWIWHAFFGTAGSNNDITVLNGSNVFDEVL
ncbi:Glutathione S-transferase T2 [Glycine max]|nr:Glutathione S-transferase T2 [Glycine max]